MEKKFNEWWNKMTANSDEWSTLERSAAYAGFIEGMNQVKNNGVLADVSGSALTKLDSKLLLPLIEKRRLEIEDYTIEFHELGHLIEKIKHNAG